MRYFAPQIICAMIGFGLLGSAKGLDEGLIATTVDLPSFIREFGLHAGDLSAAEQANRLSNITSMVNLGCLPGAVLAFLLSDSISPLRTMRQLCLLWIVGVVLVISSAGNYGQLIAGRFIVGLGIGQAGIIGPIYLAETSPTAWRGLLVGIYASSEYVGVLIGYFAGYGASLHMSNANNRQWIIPQSSQIMMAGLILIVSLGCVESPRYLCQKQRNAEAMRALSRLRTLPEDSPEIQDEFQSMRRQTSSNSDKKRGRSLLTSWKLLFGDTVNRKRLLFLLSAQLLSQWSGTNAITSMSPFHSISYAPKFFALLGMTGSSEKLFKTAIFGAVKLASALLCAVLFLDRFGRKRCLMLGITLQVLALLYMAIYFTALPTGSNESPSAHRAAIAAIAATYITGVGYAFGWNSIQYLINAEILPTAVRTLGTSLLMCVHYANRFALTKAVPTMMLADALQPKGTFWFFFVVALLGFGWGLVLLPETSGRKLEETSRLIS
ncbi:general substrate transporter [Aspergillus homomorphus CBS 101889]|uniref:General substrate transporter n=1 Tax=Aspergillus homomorphus (strain CBS 101889) TaxID=1450537 RepID=A0A395I9A4_ASPHC|nr:general substrate transporter [Aspergillus homomorphus CBS 101889]RAL16621.1 general substrate transporter [Aspergillus homomorphus CBS 101889]